MPKPAALDSDLNEPAHRQPPAATAPRTTKQKRREVERPRNDTPVNFRWPAAEVKALKRAALEADMTLQDFMFSCFHAFLQKSKTNRAAKMPEHKFGGDWTERKLSCLKDYLNAYRRIFTKNERAHYLKTWYVDAFAGTGSRTVPGAPATGQQSVFEDVYEDTETTQYRDGSAKIALTLAEPFDFYLFIEKSKARVNALENAIKQDHEALYPRCQFRHGDSNDLLQTWCKERDWRKERAVVFLDPYGMQVRWSTIEALAATKAIDLWYLFPLGVGAARLLTHSGDIDQSWQNRLDLLFGTPDWRTEFYRVTPGGQTDLFGETRDVIERDAPVSKIEAFIHKHLDTTFVKTAKGLVLKNSRQSPLYLLCFAAANERGAPTAIRIAQDILKED